MMINKRLIGMVSESKKYVVGNVALQWCSLAANITVMTAVTGLFASLYEGTADSGIFCLIAAVAAIAIAARFLCTVGAGRMGYLSSKMVKKVLREKIYRKLLRLGVSYREQAGTSEVVQMASEGVEQLETYFGAYLPQFFYAALAPLTLFARLCFVDAASAAILLACVPLIPVSIAAVQTWAKKLLSKYWGQYTALGDTFLENLQGLTTLKIYRADGRKHEEMNREAEKFRRITMKVLTMQLNSITMMDLVAYGGAALGVVMAVARFRAGPLSLSGCLLVILLSADFFLPMRQRLALARALLHDSPAYIFDEATSNIDVESKNDIMGAICALAGKKTVILISHRLANVASSDHIYVMEQGRIAEGGRHGELLEKGGVYAGLWETQQELENYGGGASA